MLLMFWSSTDGRLIGVVGFTCLVSCLGLMLDLHESCLLAVDVAHTHTQSGTARASEVTDARLANRWRCSCDCVLYRPERRQREREHRALALH